MGLNRNKMLLAIPAVIFGADGVIKHFADKKMELNEPKEIFGGRLILQKRYNEGAAFGILASKPKVVLWVQSVFFSIAAIWYAAAFFKKGKTGLKISLGMLLGGGMSNLYDHLRKQHVVDYVRIPFKNKYLSRVVFNISDVFIFIGVIFTALFGDRKKKG